MKSPLFDAFRHNTWATRTLLDFCHNLSDEQLATSSLGVFGSTRATLQHLILSEARYYRLITGVTPWEPLPGGTSLSLDEIAERADRLAGLWEVALDQEIDVDRILQNRGDEGSNDTAIGVVVAQVLNHGNEHRSQICTVLTTMGIEPPELDAWAYGFATGRIVPV